MMRCPIQEKQKTYPEFVGLTLKLNGLNIDSDCIQYRFRVATYSSI